MEWQASARKTYARGRNLGINTGDMGNLESVLGRVNGGFGEDVIYWVETEMGQ